MALFGIAAVGTVVLVAVERSIDSAGGGLTYGWPAGAGEVAPGDRVWVPLGRGNRRAEGVVLEVWEDLTGDGLSARVPGLDPLKLKDALGHRRKTRRGRRGAKGGAPASGDADRVRLDPQLMALARWIASYYCCPLGMVLGAVVPAAVKDGTGIDRSRRVRRAADAPAEGVKLTRLQRSVVAAAGADWADAGEVLAEAGARTRGPLDRLVAAGVLEQRWVETLEGEVLGEGGGGE